MRMKNQQLKNVIEMESPEGAGIIRMGTYTKLKLIVSDFKGRITNVGVLKTSSKSLFQDILRRARVYCCSFV